MNYQTYLIASVLIVFRNLTLSSVKYYDYFLVNGDALVSK